MASLKNIKLKILSYKKTGTVTHAMEAVSAVKMRKAQRWDVVFVFSIVTACVFFSFPLYTSASTIVSGHISSDTTWVQADSPYIIGEDFTIEPGTTLTIQPGVVVKFDPTAASAGGFVDGKIAALGTTEDPIIFTSLRDDTSGGDTNGDGATTSPVPGEWLLLFSGTSSSSSVFEHVAFRYADTLSFDHAVASFTHTEISLADTGIYAENGSMITLADSFIHNIDNEAIFAVYGSSVTASFLNIDITGNEGVALYENAVALLTDTMIEHTGSAAIALYGSTATVVRGILRGGDASGIELYDIDLPHTSDLTMTDSTIEGFPDYGITSYDGAASIERSRIVGNDTGIEIYTGDRPASDEKFTISHSIITGNYLGAAGYGPYPLDARDNWWGDVSGPFHYDTNPEGLGDEAGDDVLFDPWLATDPFATLPPMPPSIDHLAQYREFGVDAIPASAGFIGNAVVLKADVADTDSVSIRLEVELKPVDTPFDGTGTYATSTPTTTAPIATTLAVSINDLIHPSNTVPSEGIRQSFHWRARALDAEGHESEWVEFSPDALSFTATYTLGLAASDLARQLVNQNYLWGGKGWDVADREFVDTEAVRSAYLYWNPDTKSPTTGNGVDCSGLVAWSYDRTVDPAKYFTANFIKFENADGQYKRNTVPVTEATLQPGDLLFFDNLPKDGRIDHVAMYVGDRDGYDVVEARSPRLGIRVSTLSSAKIRPEFVSFARPQNSSIAMAITKHSPVHLSVTDPDGVTVSDTTSTSTEEEFIRESGDLFYATQGVDSSGYPEDIVYSPVLKLGVYRISVSPMASTTLDQTYSLDFTAGSTTIPLAINVPLAQIPTRGYSIVVGNDQSITLDNTPPEAHIGFNTSAKKISTTGSDDLASPIVSTTATSTTITDAAANTLTLNISKSVTQPNYSNLVIPSFTYSTGTTTNTVTSLRYFWLTDKVGKYKLLISAIRTPAERLVSVYMPLLNKTYILESNPTDDTSDLATQTIPLLLRRKLKTYTGMVVPHISTNKGSVVVEY